MPVTTGCPLPFRARQHNQTPAPIRQHAPTAMTIPTMTVVAERWRWWGGDGSVSATQGSQYCTTAVPRLAQRRFHGRSFARTPRSLLAAQEEGQPPGGAGGQMPYSSFFATALLAYSSYLACISFTRSGRVSARSCSSSGSAAAHPSLCSIPDPQEAKGKLGRTDVEEAGLLDARQHALVRPERVAILAQRVLWRFPAGLRPWATASRMHVPVRIAREANQPAPTAQVVK